MEGRLVEWRACQAVVVSACGTVGCALPFRDLYRNIAVGGMGGLVAA